MSTLVGGMMPHGHHHHHNHHSGGGQTCGPDSLPPRFPYGRPDFLDLTPELLQYSTEHASRPVLALKRGSRLPWRTGYAEVINGKSMPNEDQASCEKLFVRKPKGKHQTPPAGGQRSPICLAKNGSPLRRRRRKELHRNQRTPMLITTLSARHMEKAVSLRAWVMGVIETVKQMGFLSRSRNEFTTEFLAEDPAQPVSWRQSRTPLAGRLRPEGGNSNIYIKPFLLRVSRGSTGEIHTHPSCCTSLCTTDDVILTGEEEGPGDRPVPCPFTDLSDQPPVPVTVATRREQLMSNTGSIRSPGAHVEMLKRGPLWDTSRVSEHRIMMISPDASHGYPGGHQAPASHLCMMAAAIVPNTRNTTLAMQASHSLSPHHAWFRGSNPCRRVNIVRTLPRSLLVPGTFSFRHTYLHL
ncbi:protein phosphatase 1H-like protein [Lates japonicus]|uniref:Protein phosphatase 1H-like protein n=1 Tax=Lates japonicus TaxID=270547 RepID=A0AAD3RM50_LATJO|nr:protein phosphatase 1H-like protein [Lates japonicus]